MSKQRQRSRLAQQSLLAAFSIAFVVVALGGCGDGSRRGAVEVVEYKNDGRAITVIAMSCDGTPEIEVEESDLEVRVSVVSTTTREGNSCQDQVKAVLADPLGERTIVDTFSGEKVPVQ